MVMATWLLGCRWYGRRAGFWAAVALLTFPLLIDWSRRVRSDAMMAMWVAVAAWLVDGAATAKGRRALWGFWVAAWLIAGLGVLSKGVHAALFVGGIAVATWRARRGRWLPPAGLLAAAPLLVVTLPAAWAIAAEIRNPGHLSALLGYQLGPALSEHPRHWRYYFSALPSQTLPWVVFAVGAIWIVASRWRRTGYDVACVPAAVLVAALAVLTAVPNRRVHFLLPVLPFWALLLGSFLDRATPASPPGVAGVAEETPAALRHLRDWPLRLCLLALLAAGLAGPFVVRRWMPGGLWLAIPLGLAVAVAAACGLVASCRGRAATAVWTFLLAGAGLTILGHPLVRRAVSRPCAGVVAARKIEELVPRGAPLGVVDCPAITRFLMSRSVTLLTTDESQRAFLRGPGTHYLAVGPVALGDIQQVSPAPVRVLGRWSDDDGDLSLVVVGDGRGEP
jgi:4-amino-4-deoxy-L-arabinose transferase-like glycosyltransferase